MKKSSFILFLIIVLGLVGTIVYLDHHEKRSQKTQSLPAPTPIVQTQKILPQKTQPVLFYATECPHCIYLEKYIKTHQLHKKVTFKEKDVSQNIDSLNALIIVSKKCHLPPDVLEVPLMWTGKQCLRGNKDIIDFLNKKVS